MAFRVFSSLTVQSPFVHAHHCALAVVTNLASRAAATSNKQTARLHTACCAVELFKVGMYAGIGRASLEDMFDDYLQQLPQYRGCVNLEGVRMQRAVFGFVPNWHDQPLAPITSRLLHVGDAAGNRSALSFAGGARPWTLPMWITPSSNLVSLLMLVRTHGKDLQSLRA